MLCMMGEEDWDLFAIVRSCQSATVEDPPTTTTTTTVPLQPTSSSAVVTCTDVDEDQFESFSFSSTNEELEQLLIMPLNVPTMNPNSPDFSPHHLLPPPTSQQSPKFHNQLQLLHHKHQQLLPPHTTNSPLLLPNTQPQIPRSRKRKSQQKKMVCHVKADNLSADLWAWRKYGQKPIKGSPYPRNYYRCSSSKGCSARKQVERSNVEPDMFIVTYTGDHTHPRPTHRNSLAGSTRSKSPVMNPPPSQNPLSFQPNHFSSPSTTPHSPVATTEPPENHMPEDSDGGENGGEPADASSHRTGPI